MGASRLTRAQHWNLRLSVSPDGEEPFRSEEERERAWRAHGAEISSEIAERLPGHRPAAFWRYTAERPDLAGADQADDAERVRVLAAGGHLTRREIAALRRKAREAAARIDTERERGTLLAYDPATGAKRWCPHTADRLAVAVGEAFERGLR